MIPKVKFQLAKPEYDIWLMKQFLLGKNKKRKEKISIEHPKLKEFIEKTNNIDFALKNYVENFYENNIKELNKKISEFQNEWDAINNFFMEELSKTIETGWPKDLKIINAYVSITPICPRFLKSFSFSIYYKTEYMKKISAHEITHFLYFKKWKEIFPNTEDKQREAPYLIWYLSEILAPVILRNPNLIKFTETSLKTSYPLLKIKNKNIINHFEIEYKKALKRNQSFSTFLKSTYLKLLKKEKDYYRMIKKYY